MPANPPANPLVDSRQRVGYRRPVTLPIGILASGAGSNADAIADAIDTGYLKATIRIVICNRPGAPVLAKATSRGLPCKLIDHRDFATRETFDTAVAAALADAGVSLVVMAGFDRIVTPALIDRYPDRILNIHPALLPAFPGANAQEQAAHYGVTISGATVHIVDKAVDHGPIVVQAAVPVLPEDDAEAVRRRILPHEHRIYPQAIQFFAEGRVRVVGRKVFIDGMPRPEGEALVNPPLAR